jgi:hypothetical protein
MVATFETYLDTGGAENAPGSSDSIDGLGPPMLRFKRADNKTIDNVDSIPIPAGADNYSRWKSLYLRCSGAPSLQVDNIRIYSDGGIWAASILMDVGDETPTKNSGSSAGYDVADVNATMVGAHTDITGITSWYLKTVGAPKTVTISEAGAIINAIGESSDYVVLQMHITNAATPGDLANSTGTWKYDEI